MSFGRKFAHLRKIPLIAKERTTKRKMSKTLNKQQSDILLNKMIENPDIARRFVKENREKVGEFWEKLSSELNSEGPPSKSEAEWKKVWTDQKRYIRKKSSLNKMYERGTAGGPIRTQKFSPTEAAIFQLIGINEAVEIVGSSQSFGLPPPEKKRREENTISEISLDEIVLNTIEIGTRSPTAHILQIEEIPPYSSDQQTPKKRKAVVTTNEVVVEELETHKELCSEISNAISVMKDHNGETQNGIRKLCHSMERLGDIQKDRLEEQKRHNAKMEEFRKAELDNKIENDRKLLELENRKLEIMQQGEFIYTDV